MPLALQSDVEARLGRSLLPAEADRVAGLLDEAEALVIGYLGTDPTIPGQMPSAPAAVTIVVSRMVARVFDRDAGVANDAEQVTDTMGPFSTAIKFRSGTTSSAPWLAAADKTMLRPYKAEDGFTSLAPTSGRTGRYRSLDAAGRTTTLEER